MGQKHLSPEQKQKNLNIMRASALLMILASCGFFYVMLNLINIDFF
jgi:hypothetical protein